nr:TolC family protein [uncultured Carboxylicivirga sp.]
MMQIGLQPVLSQEQVLTLNQAIDIARKQSYDAFLSKNAYLVKVLDNESYKKMLFPSLNMSLTPANYDRSISELWDSEEGLYKPYEVQWLSSVGSISLNQPVGFTGGNLNVSSSLRRSMTYYENANDIENYISNPISISYSQNINAVNNYKWRSKLEPLEFEEAKKQFMEDMESTTIETIRLYYNLLDAELNLEIAQLGKNTADTLYLFGKRKLEIGAITRAEYLRLELNKINADISLESRQLSSQDAQIALNNYLELPEETKLICTYSQDIPKVFVSSAMAIEKAYENNPDMLALEQKIIESEKNIRSANANRLTASFSATLGLNQNQGTLSEAYRDLRDRQGVSFSLSLPIIDWGENKRTIQQARLNQKQVEESNRKQKDNLRIEVLKMVQEFNIQGKQVEASCLADSISKVAYKAVQQQFILGQTNIVDLNTSYSDLQSAQNNYMNTLRNFWIQLYSLRKICLYDFQKEEDLSFDEKSIIIE